MFRLLFELNRGVPNGTLRGVRGRRKSSLLDGSIIYSVDGNKNAFKVVRLRELMLLSALLFFIWKNMSILLYNKVYLNQTTKEN